MAKYYVDNNAEIKQIVDRVHISDAGTPSNIVERYVIDPASVVAKLIWERITAYFFSSDGFGIQTKDGYIIKCKDQ